MSEHPPGRRLQRPEVAWALAFLAPYLVVFAAFVVYPVGYGLWLARDPALYAELFADQRYLRTLLNTVLFVGLGVNLMMVAAVLLSGLFVRREWWVRALLAVYLTCWALPAVPAFVSFHWMLIFVAGRLAIPQEIYEAAAVDGATGTRRFLHVVFPLLANLYLVCTLLSTLWTVGDFNTVYLVSIGAPARSSEVLATLGFHYAFDAAQPSLAIASTLSVLPLLVPVALVLMRRLQAGGVQL